VETVLAAALHAGARIISLNPVKASLEDYFLARIKDAVAAAAGKGAGGGEAGRA
jgi:hypothetical protein